MPRQARVVHANYPHHIVQRGHNKQQVFIHTMDYRFYLKNLREGKVELGCKVYAYCLMNNHVHLVIDPGASPSSLAALMKHVAGSQTRYFNARFNRSGSLWEGRFHSTPINNDRYLLACCRYVELNPLRAGIVRDPVEYRWSSYRRKIGFKSDDWLDFDPLYLDLGLTPEERGANYRTWVRQTASEEEQQFLRHVSPRRPGRPKEQVAKNGDSPL
ncbi:transposase [bacterium]|nr:transposase [bacterium]